MTFMNRSRKTLIVNENTVTVEFIRKLKLPLGSGLGFRSIGYLHGKG